MERPRVVGRCLTLSATVSELTVALTHNCDQQPAANNLPMGAYIARRLLTMIPLILGITLLTFVLANEVPGSPVANLQMNPNARPADVARIKDQLGLDQPLMIRYVQWLSHVLRGDLGLSLTTYRPVSSTIIEKLPNTLLLTGCALLLSLLISVPLGIVTALRHNSYLDRLVIVTSTGGIAVPTFWLGMMMIVIFSVNFQRWGLPSLPSGGMYSLHGGGGFQDRLTHLALPVLALAFVQTAIWLQYVRTQMIEVLRQDYLRVAAAKGLSGRAIVVRHGFRNALLPLITLLALEIPSLFSGAVVIEQIFAWNGIGRLIVDSTMKRDYTVVMGTVLVISAITILANLLADLACLAIDPRLRTEDGR
jgi:peptide/nickel transport system permease protein